MDNDGCKWRLGPIVRKNYIQLLKTTDNQWEHLLAVSGIEEGDAVTNCSGRSVRW